MYQQNRIRMSGQSADPEREDGNVPSRCLDTGTQLLRLLAQLASFGLDAGAPTLLTSEPCRMT